MFKRLVDFLNLIHQDINQFVSNRKINSRGKKKREYTSGIQKIAEMMA